MSEEGTEGWLNACLVLSSAMLYLSTEKEGSEGREGGRKERLAYLPRGLLQRVEKQPADMPPRKEVRGVRETLPLSVTQFLYSLKNIKRSPWLDPCFMMVAPRP